MELVVIVMPASPDTGTTDQCSRSRISTWNRKYFAHKIKTFGSWKMKNLLCLSVRGLSKKILWVSLPVLSCTVMWYLLSGTKIFLLSFIKGWAGVLCVCFPDISVDLPQIIQYEMMLYLMGWSGIGHYSEPVIFISQTDIKPFGKYLHLNKQTSWSYSEGNVGLELWMDRNAVIWANALAIWLFLK